MKKYRVGKKQKRVILDEKGLEVAFCKIGNEELAMRICNLLNEQNNDEFNNDVLKHCDRVEVIDDKGRSYTNWRCKKVEIQLQDNCRTMKIFIK